ncbi:MAG TPA: hypothetical protein VFP49_07090 [Nitrososphaeraceae archaeon]|nr:hypothetical protein [Nitrososphaeraceae archaeon]
MRKKKERKKSYQIQLKHYNSIKKSPTEVAIKLELSPQKAQSLYLNYLSLNNLYQFIETFKQFDNESLQDFINYYYYFIKQNGICKKEVIETVKMINNFPNIKEEYYDISDQFKDSAKAEIFTFYNMQKL